MPQIFMHYSYLSTLTAWNATNARKGKAFCQSLVGLHYIDIQYRMYIS